MDRRKNNKDKKVRNITIEKKEHSENSKKHEEKGRKDKEKKNK